jgi:dimethylsulfone monooxygenase
LVGTPDHIVSELGRLSDIGFDGILLSWVDYLAGLERWNKEIMPLVEQAGLRQRLRRSEAA